MDCSILQEEQPLMSVGDDPSKTARGSSVAARRQSREFFWRGFSTPCIDPVEAPREPEWIR
jgi:hypothetical protein